MYLRGVHADATIPMLRQLIRNNPLGILTTAITSSTYPLIQSSHIPFVLDVEDESSDTELGVLRGHIARQNPQTKAMIDSLESQQQGGTNVLEQEVLVLFNSPIQHYVTPKFYVETKPTTGKVVPTWNYAAAQAYGRAKIYYDSKSTESNEFLSKQLRDLSQYCETSVMGYTGIDKPGPWEVSDAPLRYVELLQKGIIGIEIRIERLEGKFKMSQEMSQGDSDGVIKGFQRLDSEIGTEMAKIVEERRDLKAARSAKAKA
ncbi:putative FMN-binding domain-containing protein [Hypomontagnella monticulosa]|nr:putative FMN-binding domain-containing protein [Hypomontagnella monticulosa]